MKKGLGLNDKTMESAIDAARKLPNITMRQRQRPEPVLMPMPVPLPVTSSAEEPHPHSFDGIVRAMHRNDKPKSEFLEPSPGALMLMNQCKKRYPQPLLLPAATSKPNTVVSTSVGNAGSDDDVHYEHAGVTGNLTTTRRAVGAPASTACAVPLRIASRFVTSDTVNPITIISSYYNAKKNEAKANSPVLLHCHNGGDGMHGKKRQVEPKWYERKDRPTNSPRQGNSNLPISGGYGRDVYVCKDDLDDELDAYMAKARGGLVKFRLNGFEKPKPVDDDEGDKPKRRRYEPREDDEDD